MNKSNQYVAVVGTAVFDDYVLPCEPVRDGMSKVAVRICSRAGGSVINISRAARRHDAAVQMVPLTGPDLFGQVLEAMIAEEFANVHCLRCLTETRRSIIHGSHIDTVRSSSTLQQLPGDATDLLAKSELTIVGPMTGDDQELVSSTIRVAPRSLLLLSSGQLDDPHAACDVARRAWLVVVNQSELLHWTGVERPIDGLEWLVEQGLNQVLVTSETGVSGYVGGDWLSLPAPPVATVRNTIGAGDTFVGTLAAELLHEAGWEPAVRTALQAAAAHVAGERAVDPPPPAAPGPHSKPQRVSGPLSAVMIDSATLGCELARTPQYVT